MIVIKEDKSLSFTGEGEVAIRIAVVISLTNACRIASKHKNPLLVEAVNNLLHVLADEKLLINEEIKKYSGETKND